jgi:hypothetical protein
MRIVFQGRTVEKGEKLAKILISKGLAVQADGPESIKKKSETTKKKKK